MSEPSLQISLPSVRVVLTNPYTGDEWPVPTYQLCYRTDQSDGYVWAYKGADYTHTWTLEAAGAESAAFTMMGTASWRLTNMNNQPIMRAAVEQPSAIWWGEGYKDSEGKLFVRIRSGLVQNLYLCLPSRGGNIVPKDYPCNLTDSPSDQDSLWYPKLVSGNQEILNKMFPVLS